MTAPGAGSPAPPALPAEAAAARAREAVRAERLEILAAAEAMERWHRAHGYGEAAWGLGRLRDFVLGRLDPDAVRIRFPS